MCEGLGGCFRTFSKMEPSVFLQSAISSSEPSIGKNINACGQCCSTVSNGN